MTDLKISKIEYLSKDNDFRISAEDSNYVLYLYCVNNKYIYKAFSKGNYLKPIHLVDSLKSKDFSNVSIDELPDIVSKEFRNQFKNTVLDVTLYSKEYCDRVVYNAIYAEDLECLNPQFDYLNCGNSKECKISIYTCESGDYFLSAFEDGSGKFVIDLSTLKFNPEMPIMNFILDKIECLETVIFNLSFSSVFRKLRDFINRKVL